MIGKVTLIGAGPGGKNLLTLQGAETLQRADVVVYDRLVGEDILDLIPPSAERIAVGKENHFHPVPQAEINALLARLALEGNHVARLKGGDSFLFGRGGEECLYLWERHIPFSVIPGVTSALAVPALAGIPITHRGYSSSVHIITAHAQNNQPLSLDYASLVKLDGTLIFLMGLSSLEQIIEGLVNAGMWLKTPAAVIENGGRGNQRKIVSTVGTIAFLTRQANIKSPALIVVGDVCQFSKQLDWFSSLPLYGKTIAVTRPQERSETLCNRLRELGASAIASPCISLKMKEDLQPLQTALNTSYDWAVFTSPTGVNATVSALRKLGRDCRALYGMKLAALGTGTAETLSSYGLTADFIPAQFDSVHLAEGLLNQKPNAVLLLRAAQGNPVLVDQLRRAGVTVSDVPLYDTILECKKVELLREMLTAKQLDYAIFTSASTVKGFVEAVAIDDYTGFTACCIGEQTARMAQKYHMRTLTAVNATEDDIINSLLADLL